MKETAIRDMANLLVQGSQMTDLTCPKCTSILFRLKSGALFCTTCKQKVVLQKADEPLTISPSHSKPPHSSVSDTQSLLLLKESIYRKIKLYSEQLQSISDPSAVTSLLKVINELLGTLDLLQHLSS